MIITCPFCQTRFLVAAQLFAAGPRQMRCAKCKHGWRAEAPPEAAGENGESLAAVVVPVGDPQPFEAVENAPPEPDVPLLPPKILFYIRCGAGVLGVIILLWIVFGRQKIVEKIGFLEPVYEAIGLHIIHIGEDLKIEGVRSELVYEDGIMKLVVEGKITSTSRKTQVIPPLKADAIGPDGAVLQDWQIDASPAKVPPGGEVPFRSAINAPKGTTVDINLNFLEIKKNDQ